jgi:hypothetical protein
MWINASTQAIYNLVSDIRQAFPDTSFPAEPTDESFEYVGVYPVIQTSPPPYDPITQNLIQSVEYVDNQWVQVWTVEPATPEEIAQREEQAKQTNKTTAEQLLRNTDWTATVDINDPQYSNPYLGNQPEFLAYRSNVRKIAVNPPVTVDVWPTIPEEVWVTVPAE